MLWEIWLSLKGLIHWESLSVYYTFITSNNSLLLDSRCPNNLHSFLILVKTYIDQLVSWHYFNLILNFNLWLVRSRTQLVLFLTLCIRLSGGILKLVVVSHLVWRFGVSWLEELVEVWVGDVLLVGVFLVQIFGVVMHLVNGM
jgi:hypothetical protein